MVQNLRTGAGRERMIFSEAKEKRGRWGGGDGDGGSKLGLEGVYKVSRLGFSDANQKTRVRSNGYDSKMSKESFKRIVVLWGPRVAAAGLGSRVKPPSSSRS